MKRVSAAVLALGLAACTSSSSDGVADRMLRPLFVATDRTDRMLTYVLDSARSSVFAWDGLRRDYVTGRAPGPKTPQGYIGIAMGTDTRLDKLDTLFRGFAVSPTGGALAALYSYGFEDRAGHLTVVKLDEFPVEPGTNLGYEVAADAIGPFAAPDGRFIVVEPASPTQAVWKTYPAPISMFAAPSVTRMVWNKKGDEVFAADTVNERVHVFSWPGMQPVTTITVSGRPIDLALHPLTDGLAVITTASLTLYGPAPTFAVENSIPQSALPIRVAFDRNHAGEVVAVLNQNTTLSFYATSTLCGLDADSNGFEIQDLTFLDTGAFSDPSLSTVKGVGCASKIADQLWRIEYEAQLEKGAAKMLSATAITGTAIASPLVVPGDWLFVNQAPTRVTAVTEHSLYFAALTEPPAAGSAVTFSVLAAGSWVVGGERAGIIGRVAPGHSFKNQIRFVISEGSAEANRGDAFTFFSRAGVTPVFLGGVPSDMAQDRYGRFVVAIPQNQEARAVNLKRVEDAWVIQTLYAIP